MVEVEGRNIAALLNPRPVVLVTSCDINNKPNVLTVAWTMPVSHDPPLLALSISPTHHSHALLAETGECVVNIVGQQFAMPWKCAATPRVLTQISLNWLA